MQESPEMVTVILSYILQLMRTFFFHAYYICLQKQITINFIHLSFEQREYLKKQLEKTKNQKEKLESLCRSLQAERKQTPSAENSLEPVQD